uniref:hypothetical protein n=1 Tax=Citrobacter koseri TaxID=545 RepID=UPI001F3A9317
MQLYRIRRRLRWFRLCWCSRIRVHVMTLGPLTVRLRTVVMVAVFSVMVVIAVEVYGATRVLPEVRAAGEVNA